MRLAEVKSGADWNIIDAPPYLKLEALQRCAQTTIGVFPNDLTPRVWKIDLCLFEPSTSHLSPPPPSQCCWQPGFGFPLQSL